MRLRFIGVSLVLLLIVAAIPAKGAGSSRQLLLDTGWQIQSSAQAQAKGDAISSPDFKPAKWYPAAMPSTVVAALVQNKVYADPFFGMNMRSLPGTAYPIGTNFSNLPIPADSPFRVSWWYRKQFVVPKGGGEHVALNFDGINFRANIWLNGKQIADAKQVAGAYRAFEFDITRAVLLDKPNVVAVEVFPPDPTDLAITWVDWNPMPPDKNMGIWKDVYLTFTAGPVAIRYPQVITRLDMPSLSNAHLTVTAELTNKSAGPVSATLTGQIEKISFSQKVDLSPNQTRLVTFAPDQFKQLNISQPRIWWPTPLGPQNLYEMSLKAEAAGKVSDADTVRFGVREITSELTDKNYRLFKVNGKTVLIRGGGWAPDLLLRTNAEREIQEVRYVKDMNLNTIRFEGKTETNRFLDICDREGILVIAGWCCCDQWERWNKWDDEDYSIAGDSLRDQVRRIRNHPSILTWWYGSDNPPNQKAEQIYLDVLKTYNWPNPSQSSATAKPAPVTGPSGLKMNGPYEYVPPAYWLVDQKRGGAFGFATEISPGPAIPPVESLRRMLPAEHLWPIDDWWNFHAGGGEFKTVKVFTDALNARFGPATGVEDYVQKAEVMAYDGQRAMFEGYGRNKYTSTGVIQWMMNNSWPAIIWHLYDYYLRPAGGYFGTKKACEPIHIQYSYDDRSIVVVNSYYRDFKGLKAAARIYNLDMTEKFSRESALDATPDSSRRVFAIPEVGGLTSVYFLKLMLTDSAGKLLSSNFYWLSTKPDTLNEGKADWYYTPSATYADFTALKSLPSADVKVSFNTQRSGKEEVARVAIENAGRNLAFFVRLKVTKGKGGEEILPVIWQDNYISLMPGEKREITATYDSASLQGATPALEVGGWNVKSNK